MTAAERASLKAQLEAEERAEKQKREGVTPESITTIVSVQTLGNYFTVIYLPYSSDKTRSESDALEIFDHFENLVERIDK